MGGKGVKQSAVVHYALKERAVELRQINVPKPLPGHVLLKVAAVGVCGTDVHQYLNEHSWPVNTPMVLGHEFSGVIEDTGKGVGAFAPGDRVVCETAAFICGDCNYCRTGNYHLCPHREGFGSRRNGGMTQFVNVPERCLHRVPENIPMHLAAICEPCCVAYHAVAIHASIHPGMSVAVLGCGSIGIMCVQLAKLRGGYPIILTGLSRDEKRLELGKTFGATYIVAVDKDSLRELTASIGDGHGIDVVIDCSGRNITLKDAIDIVRPGGQIVRVGWGPGAYNFSLDPLVHKEATLQGVFSHNWNMWERVLGMLDSGRINVSPMTIVRLPIERWQEGFEGMHESRLIKVVLEPNGQID